MLLDEHGQINLAYFDPNFLRQTNNLRMLLSVASETHSPRIESTHFLIALIRIQGAATQAWLQQVRLSHGDVEAGLKDCAVQDDHPPPDQIRFEAFDSSGQGVLETLKGYLTDGTVLPIREHQLLKATLANLTPAVKDHFLLAGIRRSEFAGWVSDEPLEHVGRPVIFDDQAMVQLPVFSAGGRRVLELTKTEAEALGYTQIDPRHLLLGLLEYAGGATQLALYQQGVQPKKVQERLMMNLRGRAQKTRSQLALSRNAMSSLVIRILEQAAGEAETDHSRQIAEVHLLRAFLRIETFAQRQFAEAGVDLLAAAKAAQRFSAQDEAAPDATNEFLPWETVKAHLQTALIGQVDAVNACLPFVRRMLFGFRRSGHPAGVFLFCGPSGVGKTEMAKAVARAVYGGEENLIMLEMGQFQTKESMNIFVGAPPGYIGYGEGKLTNGLRDKPRSVVLFDEVEKAHPEVFDALLRFIDEGRIDDPAGPIRDGSQCIIILTSNVPTFGLEKLMQQDGYERNKWKIRQKLKEVLMNRPVESTKNTANREAFHFRPEFLNRIDEIVLFRKLGEDDLAQIAHRHLIDYARRLREEKQIDVTYVPSAEAVAKLVGHFCAPLDESARVTHRVVQTAVLDPVIDFVSEHVEQFPVSLAVYFVQDEHEHEPRGAVDFADELRTRTHT